MIKRLVVGVLAIVLAVGGNRAYAQEEEVPVDSDAVVTNSFWDNWYGQVGVDMWLQNPYGTNFKNVFPNGKTFGVDVAVGKWFTPEFGIRGVFNWENGIIKNDYASWVHEGSRGYLVFAGDIMVNLTNLLGDYRPDKKWNVSVFPRAPTRNGMFLCFQGLVHCLTCWKPGPAGHPCWDWALTVLTD